MTQSTEDLIEAMQKAAGLQGGYANLRPLFLFSAHLAPIIWNIYFETKFHLMHSKDSSVCHFNLD